MGFTFGLPSSFLCLYASVHKFKNAKHIAMIGDGKGGHFVFYGFFVQTLIDAAPSSSENWV